MRGKDSNKWPSMTQEGEWRTISVSLNFLGEKRHHQTRNLSLKSSQHVEFLTSVLAITFVRREQVQLKTGLNLLTWKTLGVTSDDKAQIRKPILISKIEIFGVAFTSQCTKCRPGTFSSAGADMCEECDSNTYSQKGAAKCLPCDKDTQYSGRESNAWCNNSKLLPYAYTH